MADQLAGESAVLLVAHWDVCWVDLLVGPLVGPTVLMVYLLAVSLVDLMVVLLADQLASLAWMRVLTMAVPSDVKSADLLAVKMAHWSE